MAAQVPLSVPYGPTCPVRTNLPVSIQEAAGEPIPDIRAYKLGKKRWSYNQVELVVVEEGGNKQLTVKQAVHIGVAPDGGERGVTFQIQLSNDEQLTLDAYLAYEVATPVAIEDPPPPPPLEVGGDAAGEEAEEEKKKAEEHEWTLVDRCACQRGCSGPVLRAIQRFGKLGKRSWGGSPTPDVTDRTNMNMKDMRYMYLSFDEAGTHVASRICKFRLVAAVYDESRENKLCTAASPPVRVLANNDVPNGAAHLQLMVNMPSTWKGWKTTPAPLRLSFASGVTSSITESPAPTKKSTRRAPKPANSSDSESLYSEESEAVQRSSGAAASLYHTRRRSVAAKIAAADASTTPHSHPQPAASPLCHSDDGNSPSPLLVVSTAARMTPGMEGPLPSSQQQHLSQSMPSLIPVTVWINAEYKALEQNGGSPTKRLRHEDINAAAAAAAAAVTSPLPHSANFEPHFPVLLGPSGVHHQHHQLDGTTTTNTTGQHNQHQHNRNNNNSRHVAGGGAVHHIQGTPLDDDPIAAFVELMMIQAPPQQAYHHDHQDPVIELPTDIHHHDDHHHHHHQGAATADDGNGAPADEVPSTDQISHHHHHADKYVHMQAIGAASIATPTPSALDDIFAGIHANFDSHDDAIYPPTIKMPAAAMNSNSYSIEVDTRGRGR